MESQWEKALQTAGVKIRRFQNFAELVCLYQSEEYLLSSENVRVLKFTDTARELSYIKFPSEPLYFSAC